MISVIEKRDNEVIHAMARTFYNVTSARPVDPNWNNRGRDVQQYELRVKRLDTEFGDKLKAIHGRQGGPSNAPADYFADGVFKYFTDRDTFQKQDPQLYALVHETMAYEGHQDWKVK
jgi:hypothetical protein